MIGYKNEKQIASDAIQIQTASNPIAVARTIAAMCKYYTDNGGSDNCKNQAPIALAMEQLAWLTGYDGGKNYTENSNKCFTMVE